MCVMSLISVKTKWILGLIVWCISIVGMQMGFSVITKEALCQKPQYISVKVSPDGKWIAKIGADQKGIANVMIRLTEEEEHAFEQISFFQEPEMIQFFWSPDSRQVIVLRDEEGKGRCKVYGIDIVSKEHKHYTEGFEKASAKIIQFSAHENKVAIGLNHRNPQFHDLYIIDLDSSEVTLLFENDMFAQFLVSRDLEIILKMHIECDGSWTVFTGHNEEWMKLSAEDAFQTEFLSYGSQEQSIYFLDNRFSNTTQLKKKSLIYLDQEEILGEDAHSDMDDVFLVNEVPVAYASYYTHKQWHILDSTWEEDFTFLMKEVGCNFSIINQSSDNQIWIVTNSIPDQGVLFWMYNRAKSLLTPLNANTSEPHCDYANMYPLIAKSRDGYSLVCYYTLPKEFDQGGSAPQPLPLVVVPHGGPFKVRDKFEFNPYHQWLASAGYAVLSVNFRLSSGFGKAFVSAGNGEWGGKAHLDIIDAVHACIDQGITKEGQVAILGGSYGGFEALTALTQTPNFFVCCIAICAPSNLRTVLTSIPEFWELTLKPLSDRTAFFTKRAFITSMGADPNDPVGAQYLQQCSPLNHLDYIEAPLLLIHGQNDHIVLEKEAKQIYESMKGRQKNVTYILFPNEGHRFYHFANQMFYLDQAEQFLAKYLRGRYNPANKEILKRSTAQLFQ